MQINRAAIKADAKVKFQGHYWPCVAVVAINMVVATVCGALTSVEGVGVALTLLVTNVVSAGMGMFFLRVHRGEKPEIQTMFDGFKNYGHVLGGTAWQYLWTALWAIVPVMNVIKILAYSMTPYILMDQPEVGAKDALKVSMAMTEGHKGELFVLSLSFIGWILLTCITCGIVGLFYAIPYMNVTMAAYYEQLKGTVSVEYAE